MSSAFGPAADPHRRLNEAIVEQLRAAMPWVDVSTEIPTDDAPWRRYYLDAWVGSTEEPTAPPPTGNGTEILDETESILVDQGIELGEILDAGWAAPDIDGDLTDLTSAEIRFLQDWADHRPVPGVTIWRSADPWRSTRITITCRPSITTLPR